MVDNQLGPFDCNAQDAEATALIAAGEYALSLHQPDLHVHLHFDARNVGFSAIGKQNEPKHRGKVSERQHMARVITSVLQQCINRVKACHIHGHDSHPWNEFADSISWQVRKGWMPPKAAQFASTRLMQHSLRDWAWMEVSRCVSTPNLKQLLDNGAPDPGRGWADSTIEACQRLQDDAIRYIDFRIATINIGTMGYDKNDLTSCSGKVPEIIRQCQQEKLNLIAVQEARAKFSQTTMTGSFLRLISAGLQGHAGVELWLDMDFFQKNLGCELHPQNDICVWHQTPRILAVAIRHPCLHLDVLSLYAPQRGRATDEIHAWWQEVQQVLRSRPDSGHNNPLILLGDLNCSVGSVPSVSIGEAHPDIEDEGGEHFRTLMETWNLFAVNTFEQFHKGHGWTYVSLLPFPWPCKKEYDCHALQTTSIYSMAIKIKITVR